MKHLTITYGEQILFDADVPGIAWDDRNGIKIEARQQGSGGGLAELIGGLSKARTADMAEQKRAAYREEQQ